MENKIEKEEPLKPPKQELKLQLKEGVLSNNDQKSSQEEMYQSVSMQEKLETGKTDRQAGSNMALNSFAYSQNMMDSSQLRIGSNMSKN